MADDFDLDKVEDQDLDDIDLDDIDSLLMEEDDTSLSDEEDDLEPEGGERAPVTKKLRKVYKSTVDDIKQKKAIDHAKGFTKANLSADANSAIEDIKYSIDGLKSDISEAALPARKAIAELAGNLKTMAGDGKIGQWLDKLKNKVAVESDSTEEEKQETLSDFSSMIQSEFAKLSAESGVQAATAAKETSAGVNATNVGIVRLTELSKLYYQKSLELQWRSTTALEQTLAFHRRTFEVYQQQFESIIKNTGLPDAVKIKNRELMARSFKESMFNNITGSIYQNIPSRERFTNAIRKYAKDKLDTIKDTTESVNGMVEGVSSMGGSNTAGSLVSDLILNTIYKKIGGKVLSKRLLNSVEQGVVSAATNPLEYLKSKRRSGDTGLVGKLYNNAVGMVDDIYNNYAEDDEKIKLNTQSLVGPATFDGRTYNTINTVIPRLLSKIHLEVEAIRKGDNKVNADDELRYDVNTASFIRTSDAKRELISSIQTNIKSNTLVAVKQLVDHIAERTQNYPIRDRDKILDKLKQALPAYVAAKGSITPEAMLSPEFLKFIPPELQLETSSLVNYLIQDMRNTGGARSTYDTFENMRSAFQYSPSVLNRAISGDQLDLIADTGLVTIDKNSGEVKANLKNLKKYITPTGSDQTYDVIKELQKDYQTDFNLIDDIKKDYTTIKESLDIDNVAEKLSAYWEELKDEKLTMWEKVELLRARLEQEKANELALWEASPEATELKVTDPTGKLYERAKAKKIRSLQLKYNYKKIAGAIDALTGLKLPGVGNTMYAIEAEHANVMAKIRKEQLANEYAAKGLAEDGTPLVEPTEPVHEDIASSSIKDKVSSTAAHAREQTRKWYDAIKDKTTPYRDTVNNSIDKLKESKVYKDIVDKKSKVESYVDTKTQEFKDSKLGQEVAKRTEELKTQTIGLYTNIAEDPKVSKIKSDFLATAIQYRENGILSKEAFDKVIEASKTDITKGYNKLKESTVDIVEDIKKLDADKLKESAKSNIAALQDTMESKKESVTDSIKSATDQLKSNIESIQEKTVKDTVSKVQDTVTKTSSAVSDKVVTLYDRMVEEQTGVQAQGRVLDNQPNKPIEEDNEKGLFKAIKRKLKLTKKAEEELEQEESKKTAESQGSAMGNAMDFLMRNAASFSNPVSAARLLVPLAFQGAWKMGKFGITSIPKIWGSKLFRTLRGYERKFYAGTFKELGSLGKDAFKALFFNKESRGEASSKTGKLIGKGVDTIKDAISSPDPSVVSKLWSSKFMRWFRSKERETYKDAAFADTKSEKELQKEILKEKKIQEQAAKAKDKKDKEKKVAPTQEELEKDPTKRRKLSWRNRLDAMDKKKDKPTNKVPPSEEKKQESLIDKLKKLFGPLVMGLPLLIPKVLSTLKFIGKIGSTLWKGIKTVGGWIYKGFQGVSSVFGKLAKFLGLGAAATLGTKELTEAASKKAAQEVAGTTAATAAEATAAKKPGLFTKIGNGIKGLVSKAIPGFLQPYVAKAKELVSKVPELWKQLKDKLLKRIGPKGFGKWLAKFTAKVGSRILPGIGWALLAWDLCWIVKYMVVDGHSLLGAFSKQLLGFDATDDKEPLIDPETGNPIPAEELDAVKEQQQEDLDKAAVEAKEQEHKEQLVEQSKQLEQLPSEKEGANGLADGIKASVELFMKTLGIDPNKIQPKEQRITNLVATDKSNIDRSRKLLLFQEAFRRLQPDQRSVQLKSKYSESYGGYLDYRYNLGELPAGNRLYWLPAWSGDTLTEDTLVIEEKVYNGNDMNNSDVSWRRIDLTRYLSTTMSFYSNKKEISPVAFYPDIKQSVWNKAYISYIFSKIDSIMDAVIEKAKQLVGQDFTNYTKMVLHDMKRIENKDNNPIQSTMDKHLDKFKSIVSNNSTVQENTARPDIKPPTTDDHPAGAESEGRKDAPSVEDDTNSKFSNGSIEASDNIIFRDNAKKGWKFLHPKFKERIVRLANDINEKTGDKLVLTESFRTPQEQASLIKKYGLYSKGGKAAAVGGSNHQYGLAVDINTKSKWYQQLVEPDLGMNNTRPNYLAQFGLHLPAYNGRKPNATEKWHMEPTFGLNQVPDKLRDPESRQGLSKSLRTTFNKSWWDSYHIGSDTGKLTNLIDKYVKVALNEEDGSSIPKPSENKNYNKTARADLIQPTDTLNIAQDTTRANNDKLHAAGVEPVEPVPAPKVAPVAQAPYTPMTKEQIQAEELRTGPEINNEALSSMDASMTKSTDIQEQQLDLLKQLVDTMNEQKDMTQRALTEDPASTRVQNTRQQQSTHSTQGGAPQQVPSSAIASQGLRAPETPRPAAGFKVSRV